MIVLEDLLIKVVKFYNKIQLDSKDSLQFNRRIEIL